MVVTAEEMPWLVVTAEEMLWLVVTADELKGLVVTAEEMQRPIFKIQWLRGNWNHVCKKTFGIFFFGCFVLFCFSGTVMSDCQHEWPYFSVLSSYIFAIIFSSYYCECNRKRVNAVNDVLKEKPHSVTHSVLHSQLFWCRSLPEALNWCLSGCCNWVHYCLIYVVVFSLQQKDVITQANWIGCNNCKSKRIFSCNNWIFLSIFWLGLEIEHKILVDLFLSSVVALWNDQSSPRVFNGFTYQLQRVLNAK